MVLDIYITRVGDWILFKEQEGKMIIKDFLFENNYFSRSRMNGLRVAFFGLLFPLFSYVNTLYAEEQKAVEQKVEDQRISGSISAGVFNRYIFRGYELSSKSFVVQPAVSLSYKGFSVSFWGNIDSNEHATQSFIPDRPGRKSFNETDLTLGYTYHIGEFTFTGGYIYYGTKYAAETEELFVSSSYDIITKPTLTVYRDIASYPGTYINFSLSHSEKVYKNITLDLGASAGYFARDDDNFSTEGGAGKIKYSAFHDGMVKACFTIPVIKNMSVQPIAQYWFPLSDKAKRHVYNPNGHLDETFVYGTNLVYNF